MNALSFSYLIDLLWIMLSALDRLVAAFSKSFNELLLEFGVEVQLPDWLPGDVTIMALMIGGSMVIYLIYQFTTWLLNIVT